MSCSQQCVLHGDCTSADLSKVAMSVQEDYLLPIEAATVVFGKGSEGGAHLPALRGAVAGQVVSIIIAEGQETLQAGTAVVGPGTIIAMRQQQH